MYERANAGYYTLDMRPIFERGDPQRPRGHALVYFRAATGSDVVLGSYIVVPPISMDIAKYIPPMFASQMAAMVPSGPSVFPLPPIPERVESLDLIRRLAEARDDDLLDGGTVDASDVQRLLMLMTDLAGEYAGMYTTYAERLPEGADSEATPEALPAVDVDDLLLSVMSESEKVGRVAKMTSTIRYAIEGDDRALLAETTIEMERLGRHLPDQYRVAELVQAAQDPAPDAGRLAELLLQRCYKLAAEEYDTLKALDLEIERLREEAGNRRQETGGEPA